MGLTPMQPTVGYSITVLPLHPTSIGRITLNSPDPYDHPKIDANYFATEKDREDVATCVRKAREIGEMDTLAELQEVEARVGLFDIQYGESGRIQFLQGSRKPVLPRKPVLGHFGDWCI